MKITYIYTPLGEDAEVTALLCPGDSDNGSPDAWQPSIEGVLQPAGFPGSQEVSLFARGNTIVQRPFTVHRTFGSRNAALNYAFSLEALPGTIGTLKMQNEGNSGGLWSASVGCQRAQVVSDIGVTLIIAFLFVGPRAVKGPPSNIGDIV